MQQKPHKINARVTHDANANTVFNFPLTPPFEELTRGRLKAQQSYLLIGGVGLFLTWGTSVFEIISYASRAFAVYYTLQASVAALRARRCGDLGHFAGYLILAALGASIALFGAAVAA